MIETKSIWWNTTKKCQKVYANKRKHSLLWTRPTVPQSDMLQTLEPRRKNKEFSVIHTLLLMYCYCEGFTVIIKYRLLSEHLLQKIYNLVVEKSLHKQRKAFLKKVIFQLLRRIKNIHWSKLYEKYTRWRKLVLQLLLVKGCESCLLR